MTAPYLHNVLENINLVSHIDNTPLGIIIWDKNMQVTFWSKRTTAILEWEEDEVMGRLGQDLNLAHEEDLDIVCTLINALVKGEISYNWSVNRNYTKSGKIIYCEWYNSALRDLSGNITSILSIIQDVTQETNDKTALQKSQQQLSLIYNNAIDPMWLIEVEGPEIFRFIDINTQFTTVTGLTKEQVVGKLIEEVLPPTSHEIVRAKYNEAIRTAEVIDYVEVAVHPAGKKVGEIRVIPIKNGNDQVTKLVGIANDITDRQKAENKLKETNQKLRDLTAHLQEVIEAERAEVAREIHDELGQQLTAIKMDIEWVLQNNDTKNAAPFARLSNALELLDTTVKAVRRIAMDLRPSILDDLGLQEAIAWFAKEFEKQSGIPCAVLVNNKKYKVAPALAITLFRVFQEALTNVNRHSEATWVKVELKILKEIVSLKITDNGHGFSPQTQAGKKTLGLIGMEERIRKLNGSFEVKSTDGAGTTVLVSLPKTIEV